MALSIVTSISGMMLSKVLVPLEVLVHTPPDHEPPLIRTGTQAEALSQARLGVILTAWALSMRKISSGAAKWRLWLTLARERASGELALLFPA